jgi:hypothetical protein
MIIKIFRDMISSLRLRDIFLLVCIYFCYALAFSQNSIANWFAFDWGAQACVWVICVVLWSEYFVHFGMPKVLFYVPHGHLGHKRYLQTWLVLSTASLLCISLVSMLIKLLQLRLQGAVVLYDATVGRQFLAMVLVALLLLRMQAGRLSKLFLGKALTDAGTGKCVLHYTLVVMNFVLAVVVGAQVTSASEYSAQAMTESMRTNLHGLVLSSSLALPVKSPGNVWTNAVICILSVVSCAHVLWYANRCINKITIKKTVGN